MNDEQPKPIPSGDLIRAGREASERIRLSQMPQVDPAFDEALKLAMKTVPKRYQFTLNGYRCGCGFTLWSMDLHDGVTPFLVTDIIHEVPRHGTRCGQRELSSMGYRIIPPDEGRQRVEVGMWWGRPNPHRFRMSHHSTQRHVLQGGLISFRTMEEFADACPLVDPVPYNSNTEVYFAKLAEYYTQTKPADTR